MKQRRVLSAPYPDPDNLDDFTRARSNCIVLQQSLLHRSEKLTLSLAPLISYHNVYGLALLIRAHYESTALLGYFCYRLNSFAKQSISFDDFQFDLGNSLVSSKHSHFKKAPDPRNILNCIDRADKFLTKKLGYGIPNIIADNHGWLSEFCHPNFLSLSAAVQVDEDNDTMVFRHDGVIRTREVNLLGYVNISINLFIQLFDSFEEMRDQNFPE